MTERKPPDLSFESWIDRQIRKAQERGEFDNLPGAGKPLTNLGRPDDEMWWIKEKLEREGLSTEAALPIPLLLRKEIERLPHLVQDLPSEEAVREVVAALNQRIVAYIRTPSGPQIPVSPVNADKVVERWRTDRISSSETRLPAQRSADQESNPAEIRHPRPAGRHRWWPFRRLFAQHPRLIRMRDN